MDTNTNRDAASASRGCDASRDGAGCVRMRDEENEG